ncbi:MAG: molybdopterin oxidoreductase [Bdellovibrionaceae bacterium]|nr:molybdopterin oxidoreductase [Pseudobdellovibrionaceae bacterium]
MGHSHGHVEVKDPGALQVSSRLKTFYSVLMFIGAAAFVITLASGNTERAWHAYLLGFFYTVSLSLGGLFLAALQHITKAGWSVNVRRLFESFTAYLPWAVGMGAILLVFGSGHLYEWLHPNVVAADALLQHKAPYLNRTFFWIRFFGFFGLWMYFTKAIVGRSLEQDKTGEVNLTHKMLSFSIPFIITFALSYSFFSVDTLMSLEPHWFSTIFGVYTFAGLFQSTIAFVIIVIAYLISKNRLSGFVNENHLHDLGKFLFAFTVFWAYIAFSQYMLIWYANLPEETVFFEPRSHGSWGMVSLGLILFKFIVPFLALLPQWAKRKLDHLVAVSILILIMQFVDLYWLIYPSLSKNNELVFGATEVLVFLGFIGLFIFSVARFLSKHSIVPFRDPRIQESMHHHVVY